MWHPLDGNMILADKHYEGEPKCELVELDEGGYYCETCYEYVDELCSGECDED